MWSSDSGRNKDAESAATLQDIGAVLRQARESQGMTCDQLAGSLNMGTEQLQALESGDLQRLPEPVFVTAMTRRVASKLNVDSDPLIQRLQTALANPGKPQDIRDRRQSKHSIHTTNGVQLSRNVGALDHSGHRRRGRGRWSHGAGQPTADAADHVHPFHASDQALHCCGEQQVKRRFR